jgi:uncharacterized damage-inducible protein DinB
VRNRNGPYRKPESQPAEEKGTRTTKGPPLSRLDKCAPSGIARLRLSTDGGDELSSVRSADGMDGVLESAMTVRHFLIHLHGHLMYHIGQISYIRRLLDPGPALTPP